MSRRFRVAVLAVIVVSLAAGGYFYAKSRRAARTPSALDQQLGVRRVLGVEESGFYNTETAPATNEEYRWTNGSARLVVPVPDRPPTALHVRLGLQVPKPTRLRIQVNGTSLFDETVQPQSDWARLFNLTGVTLGSSVVVEVLSDGFIPARVQAGSKDERTLGVVVRGVTLLTGTKDYRGVVLGGELHPGVDESGFHLPERCGGQPCRWTNGQARLTVPVPPGTSPRAVAVTAEVPNRPGFRVRLTVNGRTLFDDVAKPKSTWSVEFPLTGVSFDGQAVIELSSPTVVPAQHEPGSTDRRSLGLRVRKIVLLGE